jgi:hypothetical protein
MSIVIPGPIGKDGRIKKLPATGAFPGIEGANKIIVFFSEHATFATWTMHGDPPGG